jgi:chorismate dehydratase
LHKLNHLSKIKVAAVNYLNTKPLLYGIKNHPVINEIELYEAYPAMVAQMLLEGSADVGLVPVAIIPQLKEHYIITDYCIGCDGPVASVCLFSEIPIEQVTEVLLDYQSMTSVILAKILLKEYWHSDARLIEAKGEDYIKKIRGTTAGLVIGDRALEQRSVSKYIYDLGEAWKAYTGLPFVFAVWVSNKKLPEEFIEEFNQANEMGFKNLNDFIADYKNENIDVKNYFTKNIYYLFTTDMQQALELFLKKANLRVD